MFVVHNAMDLHHCCHHNHYRHRIANKVQRKYLFSRISDDWLDMLYSLDSVHEFHLMLHYLCNRWHHCKLGLVVYSGHWCRWIRHQYMVDMCSLLHRSHLCSRFHARRSKGEEKLAVFRELLDHDISSNIEFSKIINVFRKVKWWLFREKIERSQFFLVKNSRNLIKNNLESTHIAFPWFEYTPTIITAELVRRTRMERTIILVFIAVITTIVITITSPHTWNTFAVFTQEPALIAGIILRYAHTAFIDLLRILIAGTFSFTIQTWMTAMCASAIIL